MTQNQPMATVERPLILATGAGGYIGSHVTLALLQSGFDVIAVDSFANCVRAARDDNAVTSDMPESLRRVARLADSDNAKPGRLTFVELDCTDGRAVDKLFAQHQFAAIVHMASLKAVGESLVQPTKYYANNLTIAINLLQVGSHFVIKMYNLATDCRPDNTARQCVKDTEEKTIDLRLQSMERHGVPRMIFSSSATVYGQPRYLPLDEHHPTGNCANPYGSTKHMTETMIRDACIAQKGAMRAVLLRYFNPVGAHSSGEIGEDPVGTPNNLMPYITQVAAGQRPHLNVFGADYATADGTAVRDYIHIADLADGHVAALRSMMISNADQDEQLVRIYNLGTGRGYSVFEVVKAFERASGKTIPYKVTERRAGDLGALYASNDLAKAELGWRANLDIEEMCRDAWRWQSQNPTGFRCQANGDHTATQCRL